ncbi:MAG: pheophorbide a oxygenase [Monoraphidium minutum]|nr:MAG: pheophorbide a oxygenase [Monoraphidium minutum]
MQQAAPRCRGAAAPALPLRRAARGALAQRAGGAAGGSAGVGGGLRTRPHRLAQHVAPQVATTEDVVTEAPSAVPTPGGTDAIDWFKQWYPVAIEVDLDKARPTGLKLLGRSLVLWWDREAGSWSCLEDRCPHRLAPLSEGRVEPKTGRLMCSYHGWEFDGSGACTAIPQIGDAKAKAAALGSKRSCVTAYPLKSINGLLWVWADPASAPEAAAAPMALIPEDDMAAEWAPTTYWFMRDIPLNMETVVENVADPCHAPFTHHGVQGRREQEQGTIIRPLSPPSRVGFKCEQEGTTARGTFKGTFEFTAPCLLKYHFPVFGRVMAVYIVPSAAGWSRMITRFYKSKAGGGGRRPGLFGLFLAAMQLVEGNRVLEHALMRNTVLDGDNYLLHVQERALLADAAAPGGRKSPQAAWREAYFMPGASDTGVSSWRSWLDSYGRAFPLLPSSLADLPPQMTRRQVLDRFSQHTEHCPSCRSTLARIDAALPLLAALSAALLLLSGLSLATGAAPLASGRVLGCAAGAAAAAFLRSQLQSFRELFVFRDYVHAEKN